MSAEQTVRLDGTTSITVGGSVAVSNFPNPQPVSGSVSIADSSGIAHVASNHLLVGNGTELPTVTLTNATSTGPGSTVDFGSAKNNVSAIVIGTGGTNATVSFQFSFDGTNWAGGTQTTSLTGDGTYQVVTTGFPARYVRLFVNTRTGGTLNASVMGA